MIFSFMVRAPNPIIISKVVLRKGRKEISVENKSATLLWYTTVFILNQITCTLFDINNLLKIKLFIYSYQLEMSFVDVAILRLQPIRS